MPLGFEFGSVGMLDRADHGHGILKWDACLPVITQFAAELVGCHCTPPLAEQNCDRDHEQKQRDADHAQGEGGNIEFRVSQCLQFSDFLREEVEVGHFGSIPLEITAPVSGISSDHASR
jgi:hypothetical protein